MTDLTSYAATRLAELIRTKAISSVDVATAFLAQIEEFNPSLNAIVTLSPHVMDQAKQADEALRRGDAVGPLHGVPFTVKDTIDTAGLRTTSGSALRANRIAETDAPAVARVKRAGAILLGKTNTAEMAMDYTADNPVFGRTVNPFDQTRTPGGSSGGEAAAIARGLSPMGLGSDLAGSIRIPAHFCGIAGFKPSTGRVPGEGQCPPAAGPYALGSVIGPMAKCVQDLRVLFNVLCKNSSAADQPDMKGQRIAWYTDDAQSPVTAETRSAVQLAARALTDAGMIVEERRPPGVEFANQMWLKLFSRATVVFLRKMYSGKEEIAGSFIRWRLANADETPPPSLDEYINSWFERDRMRAELLEWMNSCPLLLAPVGAVPAPKHDALKVDVDGTPVTAFRAFSYAQAFNAFDLPALTVPVLRSAENLPIGVQIVGRPGDEERIFAASEIIERTCQQQ